MAPPQIKSEDRVRDLAEVYTNEREVNAMLDLTREVSYQIDSKYLEPSCGNGNFLAEILRRKLQTVIEKYKNNQKEFEFYTLVALSSIYGIDICPLNIKEAKDRLCNVIIEYYSDNLNTFKMTKPFSRNIWYILNHNIICGNMLTGQTVYGKSIAFIEFFVPKPFQFALKWYKFQSMFVDEPVPYRSTKPVRYTNLGGKR